MRNSSAATTGPEGQDPGIQGIKIKVKSNVKKKDIYKSSQVQLSKIKVKSKFN